MGFYAKPEDVADMIRPLLPMAKKAYGSQPPNSPERQASDMVNAHILKFVEMGGKVPDLARALDGDISLSGLRRRVRIARGIDKAAEEGQEQVVGKVSRPRGTKDPTTIKEAVKRVSEARDKGGRQYGDAVREVYEQGVSLQAVADQLGISYYSLWSAKRTSY